MEIEFTEETLTEKKEKLGRTYTKVLIQNTSRKSKSRNERRDNFTLYIYEFFFFCHVHLYN